MLTDPIADMLTRIRNALRARLTRVVLPSSRMRREIASLLVREGFISGFQVQGDEKKPLLVIELRYSAESQPMIEGIERTSKPSRRVYVGVSEIPRVRNGLGVAILSTPHGILTDREAREAHTGGEVLARVW
ncbi:MAG: 30S ribosomal protein S8 [Myxococcota bacterium]